MNKNKFSKLYFLNREIEKLQKTIADLNYSIKFVERYSDEEKKNFIKKEKELSDILFLKQKQCIIEQNKLESFIQQIPQSVIRLIFAYRYINGLTFKEIASLIGNCDESYVRKKHNLFLEEIKNVSEKS